MELEADMPTLPERLRQAAQYVWQGEPTQPDREHIPGETLAVITFDNVESLDVVAAKLITIRQKMVCGE